MWNVLWILLIAFGIVYLVLLVMVGMYGETTVDALPYPLLSMMEAVTLPGNFVQRIDVFLMIFLLYGLFAVISGYAFYSSHIAFHFWEKWGEKKMENHMDRWMVWIIVLILYGVSLFLLEANPTMEEVFWYGAVFDVPAFLISLFIALYQGRKRRRCK